MRIAQLSDTHVVAPGRRCHGLDTGAYLSAAIDTVNGLAPAVDFTIVTGDLTDRARPPEYAEFARRCEALGMPWAVIPGNHDLPDPLRAALAPVRFGESHAKAIDFVYDLGGVRVVGLDANVPGPWPGARFTPSAERWLEATLAASTVPTLLAVHHPPFSSGLWYLELFGFPGARRLRAVVDRHAHVGRVVAGHIHCVRSVTWRHALACSAPSTAPQFVPMFHDLDVLMQEPGFAIHDHDARAGWTTTIYRRAARGYEPAQRFADAREAAWVPAAVG